MAGIILTAAGLGLLALGAQPPTPEWGAMVATGRDVILDQWWVATILGLAIFVVSLGFNLLGDGLRGHVRSEVAMSAAPLLPGRRARSRLSQPGRPRARGARRRLRARPGAARDRRRGPARATDRRRARSSA